MPINNNKKEDGRKNEMKRKEKQNLRCNQQLRLNGGLFGSLCSFCSIYLLNLLNLATTTTTAIGKNNNFNHKPSPSSRLFITNTFS